MQGIFPAWDKLVVNQSTTGAALLGKVCILQFSHITTYSNHDYPFPFLAGVLSDRFIVKLANSLGAVYLQLGMLLGVSMAFVKRMESDWVHDSLRVTIEVLNRWRETSPHRSDHDARTTDLVTALTSLDLTDVAEMVIDGKCVG